MLVELIALLIFAAVTLAVVGLLRRQPSALETRIQDFRERVIQPGGEEADLTLPFGQRIMRPALETMVRAVVAMLPASVLSGIEKSLVTAGHPMSLNAFVALWLTTAASFSGLILFVAVLLGGGLSFQVIVAVLLFGSIGCLLPVVWLRGRVKARQKQILKELPDALDLITTCVEAGLGLDAALARVAGKSKGPLADELTQMLREVAMGRLRREALTDMGQRTGVPELITFINAVIQAEQLGVGIAQVLRVQSEQMRTRRRQRAEQTAHEAPIKMLFPLVFFIFPAFLLVILGPGMIRIGESLLK